MPGEIGRCRVHPLDNPGQIIDSRLAIATAKFASLGLAAAFPTLSAGATGRRFYPYWVQWRSMSVLESGLR
jgi:hypothetical protein